MTRMVNCAKLKIEAEGLEKPPYPGELGQRIYDSISQKAWFMWTQHQTMLINEYRLSMIDPQARAFLTEEMKKFLFEDAPVEKPAGYVAPTKD